MWWDQSLGRYRLCQRYMSDSLDPCRLEEVYSQEDDFLCCLLHLLIYMRQRFQLRKGTQKTGQG